MPDIAEAVPAPLLTVLIPTCDRWSLLAVQARAVDLVLHEKAVAFEIVIHDTSILAPPAGFTEILPPSVRIIRSPKSFGTVEDGLCEVLQHCRAEYVWILSPEDGIQVAGVAGLVDILLTAKEDIILFNDLRGRNDSLERAGGYLMKRARHLIYEKDMQCPIAMFIERTGFFTWTYATSSAVVRRSILDADVLRKYIDIDHTYARTAWLIEIGKERRFLFVNRPLVVYGEPHPDGDIREERFHLKAQPAQWLRMLDELIARDALTLNQVRRCTEMDGAAYRDFASILAHQVLLQLGELPEPIPTQDLAQIASWMLRLSPGTLFLTALIDEIGVFTVTHRGSLLRIEQDSRHGQAVRAEARDLRGRATWWKRAIGETAWYARFYIETIHFYDLYELGSGWVAAHVGYSALGEALEMVDLPSLPPAVLCAPTYARLRELIEAQPLEPDALARLRSAAVVHPQAGARLRPESSFPQENIQPTASVEPPPVAVGRDEEAVLRAELARQDAQLAQVYGSSSWRLTGWIRRLSTLTRSQPAPASDRSPPLMPGVSVELGGGGADSILARGFAPAEDWGCWTDGPTAMFRFRHPAHDAAGGFEIWPKMVWDGGGTRPCIVEAAVNGGPRKRFRVQAGEMFSVPVPASAMASPELEVALYLLKPKTRGEAPVDDVRALGVGVAAVRLATDPGRSAAL